MAIPARMLFPDERIGRDGVQRIEIIGAQRTERDELPVENRLEVETHGEFSRGDAAPRNRSYREWRKKRARKPDETATLSSVANSYRSPIAR